MSTKAGKILRRIFKVLAWSIGGLIFLLLLITLSTRLPFVQEIIKDKAISFFKDKTSTEASIGSLYINFPSSVELNQIYIEDQAGDTLVYADRIRVRTDLLDLLSNKLSLDDVFIRDLVGNVHNSATDSTFNYQFIADAFTGQPGASPQEPDSSAGFDFGLYGVDVQQARVRYEDAYNGMELQLRLMELLAEASVFDLNTSQIYVESVHLQDADGSFRISKELPESTDTVSSAFYVNGEQIFVKNVNFLFEDIPGGIRVDNRIGQANIVADSVNIVDQIYDAREITLLDTKVSVDLFAGNEPETDTTASSPADSAFSLLASSENITMGNVDFRFYDHTAPATPDGFDPMHMWFQQMNLAASEVQFEDGFAQGVIDRLSGTENRGFVLREFHVDFNYGANESSLESLHILTSHSRIEGTFQVDYPSLEVISTRPEAVRMDISLRPSVIDLRDVTYFVPDLNRSLPETISASTEVSIRGDISGTLDDLDLENVLLRAGRATRLAVNGSIRGLPDITNMEVDLPTLRFNTLQSDLHMFLPDSLFPAGVQLPDTMMLEGSLAGGISDARADIRLNTSEGALTTELSFKQGSDSLARYNGHADISAVDLGRILQVPELGRFSASLDFNGSGLNPQEMESTLSGYISQFAYNNYSYDTVYVDASVNSSRFDGKLTIADPNLAFNFNGEVGLSEAANTYSFDLDLEKADLEELNLSETEFQFLGNVSARITAASIDDMNGYVMLTNTYINRDGQIIPVDSLNFTATSAEDTTSYQLYSNFVEADFTGTFQVSQLPLVISQHFSKYYELEKSDTIQLTELRPQSFDFQINVKNPRVFTALVPNLTELNVGPIEGEYDSREWMMDLNVQVNHVVYNGLTADSLHVNLESDEYHLTYSTKARSVQAGPVTINNVLFNGDVESDRIMAELHILDEQSEDRYLFGGIFISYQDHYRFMFTPGKFITNYNSWEVKPSNAIDLFPSETWVSNLFLSYNDQELRLFSEVNERQDSILNVDISNLKLDQFGRITQDSVPILSGTVNGQTEWNLINQGLAFTSDLQVSSLSYRGDTLGNLDLQADTQDGMTYAVDMSLNSRLNDLTLQGEYDADSTGQINMDLSVNRLALSTVESFTMGQVSNMTGHVNGNIAITGTGTRPEIDGNLGFNQVSFNTTFLGAEVNIDQEELHLDNNGIHFSDFTLNDSDGDPAILNGDIQTNDFLVYQLDLDIRLRAFKLINRPLPDGVPRGNNPYYGNLDATSTVTVKGTSVQPVINIDASFTDGSTFAYVIPEETLSEQEQKDVVQWFDQDIEEIEFFREGSTREEKDSVQRALQGINLSARISVKPTNELSIVIDPLTGDRLTVKGNANLNYAIRPSGTQTLSGRFEVTSGSYALNFYNLIKREFEIQEGSYILWTGDPLNAIMNVTARYSVRASPVGVNNYQGKLDFLVYLDIGGQLLSPEISFRLGLAPDAPAPIQVEAWVNQQNAQEERVNKQVFGLLLFQTFFPDDSYASAGNVNVVENTARSSVSRLLSAQLSRLSNQIQGVDLSIDIDSYQDYSSSGESFGRTELELGVSKELFNERVVVKLAGNVDLEGNRSRQGVSDFAGDIQIEYKLTEDGRFRLIGFRNNEFDNLQGEIIRTGVGIIYVREYNALRELFQFGQDKQENTKDNQEEEKESQASEKENEDNQEKEGEDE